MILAKDNKTQKLELYGIHDSPESCFGKGFERVYGDANFFKIGPQISHEKVISFSCTIEATFILTLDEQKIKKPSVDPDHPDDRELIHFYKTGNDWKFFHQEDYNDIVKKNTIPEICFATRHPVKNLDLPNLEDIINAVKLKSQEEVKSAGLKFV